MVYSTVLCVVTSQQMKLLRHVQHGTFKRRDSFISLFLLFRKGSTWPGPDQSSISPRSRSESRGIETSPQKIERSAHTGTRRLLKSRLCIICNLCARLGEGLMHTALPTPHPIFPLIPVSGKDDFWLAS